jgi:rRNA maturation endonuclease Nob1
MTYILRCLDCIETFFDELEGYGDLLPPCPLCGGEAEIIDMEE